MYCVPHCGENGDECGVDGCRDCVESVHQRLHGHFDYKGKTREGGRVVAGEKVIVGVKFLEDHKLGADKLV